MFQIASETDMCVAGKPVNGEIAIKQTAELLPDIVVINFSMTEMNGFKATERIKRPHPKIKKAF